MRYCRRAWVALLFLVLLYAADALCSAQDSDDKPRSDVVAIGKEVHPFALVRQGPQLWPSERRGQRPQQASWGLRQTWARPHEEDSVSVVACSFANEEQALDAARAYSVSMAAIFREGGVKGESFGDKCWHSGNRAVVFSRGRLAFAISTHGPGARQVEAASTLALFARAFDRRAKKAIASGATLELTPGQETGEPSPRMARVSRPFSEAVAANNLEVLAKYALSVRPHESEGAIASLAKSVQGRKALSKILNDPKTGKLRVRLILAALGNVATGDATDYLQRYAQGANAPELYGTAIEAAAKSMPFHEAQLFCVREAERLAGDLDASAEKLAHVVKGLSPGLMREGDPAQTVVLREILRRTKNEKLRARCYRVLADWVLDGSDVRDEILRLLRGRLNDENARVSSCAARTLGRSRDVRDVRRLRPLLDEEDRSVRGASARAICELLGWESIPREDADMAQLKTRLAPILEALKTLEAAIRRE